MQPANTKYLSLYIEANPNPNSLKFVANYMLVPQGKDYDFDSPESASQSPLAQKLFELPYVERVFFMSNFVTVTKNEKTDWEEVSDEVKELIIDYLRSGQPVLKSTHEGQEVDENMPELHKKIRGLLDEYVRPAVESDGGAINFVDFEQGTVKVELRGSCSGCPSSMYTLKAGIENLLKRFLPEDVKEVEAVEA